jgi:hypothetical protein
VVRSGGVLWRRTHFLCMFPVGVICLPRLASRFAYLPLSFVNRCACARRNSQASAVFPY